MPEDAAWRAWFRRHVNPRARFELRRVRRGLEMPRWGNLRRLRPFSEQFGAERGTPIDRYYLHRFLDQHRHLITGRRIYDNLRKAMGFIFAVHVPIAGLALLPLVLDLPMLFGPMHIAFLEMVIDPVCSLVFEAETEEDDVMRRPPRSPDAPLFSGPLIGGSLLQGACAFALVAAIFIVASRRGMPEDEVRALTFFSLVVTIVSLIFVNRSFSASIATALRRPNPTLAGVLVAVTAMLGLTLRWPLASGLFRFGPLHADDLSLTLAAGALVLGLLELFKPRWRARLQS